MTTHIQILTMIRDNPGLTPTQVADFFGDISPYQVKEIMDSDDYEFCGVEIHYGNFEPMMKGLSAEEIQIAARYDGTLWGGDA